jgi:hypothetical protein
MLRVRQAGLCCAAIALLVCGLPGNAAPGADAGWLPCHPGLGAAAIHNTDCPMGCETSPGDGSLTPDWAPPQTRLPDPQGKPAGLTTPDHPLRLIRPAGLAGSQGPRAPPARHADTPVARGDVLRD